MKMHVVVTRDDDQRPTVLEIKRGRKKLKLKYVYSPVGDTYSIDFKGRRDVLPSLAEIMLLVDKKRLDRIATIELIKLLEKIEVIDEVTLLKTIQTIQTIQNVEHAVVDQITTVRDMVWTPQGLIYNPSFEEGFVGWLKIVNPANIVIDSTDKAYGLSCCKFMGIGTIQQVFPIPIGVDWMEELFLWARQDVTAIGDLQVGYAYTDAMSSTETTLAVTSSWGKIVLSPTAGKKIIAMTIGNVDAARTVKIDAITPVF